METECSGGGKDLEDEGAMATEDQGARTWKNKQVGGVDPKPDTEHVCLVWIGGANGKCW